ncbi:MAG: polysaccharide deacetylase, partial [Agathobacter sp.]|nr:polysaccharide deacetylase [Agathobacter sp.]
HTWGHIRVGDKYLSTLKTDNEKWQRNIAPIVGETNIIIFAHGQDLGKWGDYDLSNEKVQYFMSQGFDVFCNVDSFEHRTHFGGTYLRQGRRNLDGIRFHYNLTGQQNNLSDLFDVTKIIDPERPAYEEFLN